MADLPRFVIPEELAYNDWEVRLDWLLKDSEGDALNSGIPRYEPRYTDREQEILGYLRLLRQTGRGDQ